MDPASSEIAHEGSLTKKGKIRRNWQRRWCVLEAGQLKYYKSKPSGKKTKPSGSIQVAGSVCGEAPSSSSKYANSFQIQTKGRNYYLYSDTPEEFQVWKNKLIEQGGKWDDNLAKSNAIQADGSISENPTPVTATTPATQTNTTPNVSTERTERSNTSIRVSMPALPSPSAENLITSTNMDLSGEGEQGELPVWDAKKEGVYNPLLDGFSASVNDLWMRLEEMAMVGVIEPDSTQSKLLEAFRYVDSLKTKYSVELSPQDFNNLEYVSSVAEEEKTNDSSASKEDSRWSPYGPTTKPKEEEINAQLDSLDETLCFASDSLSKREIIPLLRTSLSLESKHRVNNNFGASLRDRLLVVKNTQDALVKKRNNSAKDEDDSDKDSHLSTVTKVTLQAIIDLISGPVFNNPKVKVDPALSIGIMDTLTKTFQSFPLLCLMDDDRVLDPMCLNAVVKLEKWLMSMVDAEGKKDDKQGLELRQKALQVMIELALASGSLEVILAILSKLLLPSKLGIDKCFPLAIGPQLQSLAEFSELEEDKTSLGVPSRFLDTWDFYLPIGSGASEELVSEQALRTTACDGTFLYFHDKSGLKKVGTGYHGTVKGKIYQFKAEWRPFEKVWLGSQGTKLFCMSDAAPNEIFTLSSDTLEVLIDKFTLQVPKEEDDLPTEADDKQAYFTNHQALVLDGRYFLVIRQKSSNSALLVDIYDPREKMKHIRRVKLLTDHEEYTNLSAERFNTASYISNGKFLMAIVPHGHRESYQSPEECNVTTWEIETGECFHSRVDIDLSQNPPEEDDEPRSLSTRALYTTCYDVNNNIIWTYLPFSKKVRVLENVGLPSGEAATLYPKNFSPYRLDWKPGYFITTPAVSMKQTAVSFLSTSLRFSMKVRPFVEELGIPKSQQDQDTPRPGVFGLFGLGNRKKVKPTKPPVCDVPFSIQPTRPCFELILEVLEHYSALFLKGGSSDGPFDNYILYAYLEILRVNLFQVVSLKKSLELPLDLMQRFQKIFSSLLESKQAKDEKEPILMFVVGVIAVGLTTLYPSRANQSKILSQLVDHCSGTRGKTILSTLALVLQNMNLSQWFLPTPEASDDANHFVPLITQLFQRSLQDTKAHLSKMAAERKALKMDISAETSILFIIQKHLLSCTNTEEEILFTSKAIGAFGARLLDSCKELYQFLNGGSVAIEMLISSNVIDNSVAGAVLPYFLVGCPPNVESAKDLFAKMIDVTSTMDSLNVKFPNLDRIEAEYNNARPEAKKVGSKKVKVTPSLPTLIDLERLTAWSAGKLVSSCIQGTKVTEAETETKTLLHFDLFTTGLDNDYLDTYKSPKESSDAESKFTKAFIDNTDESMKKLHEAVSKVAVKGLQRQMLSSSMATGKSKEDLARLERIVIAALLKHLNFTALAMNYSDSLKKESTEPLPELTSVWIKAEKFKRWVIQEAQKISSESEADLESITKNFMDKASFILNMPVKQTVTAARPGSQSVTNKFKGAVNKLNKLNSETTVGWNNFFSVWKSKRQAASNDEGETEEKKANEVISFLKDGTDLSTFVEAVRMRRIRAQSRAEGLLNLDALLSKITLVSVKVDVLSNLPTALRKTDIIEHQESHSVLDDLQAAGQDSTSKVLAGFTSIFTKLSTVLKDSAASRDLQLTILDLWNLHFKGSEQFLLDSDLVTTLVRLSKLPVLPASPSEDSKKEKKETKPPSVQDAAWTLLRIISIDAVNKRPTSSQSALTHKIISTMSSELATLIATFEKSTSKPEKDAAALYCSKILLLLYSLCKPVNFPHLATPEWVTLLLSIIRYGPLKTKMISFRLLRHLLHLVDPLTLENHEKGNKVDVHTVDFFFQVIGIAFEASSDVCASTIRTLLSVGTTHDVFSVASEAIMLIRLLIVNSEAWARHLLEIINEALAQIPDMFKSQNKLSKSTVTVQQSSIWSAIASLCILGGNRDTLRLGGRVRIRTDASEETSATSDVLGTLVEFHRMGTTARVIKDSHKESTKTEVSRLTGILEVAPNPHLIPQKDKQLLFTTFLKQDDKKQGRNTLFFQFRSAVMKVLVESLQSEAGMTALLLSEGLLPPLIQLSLKPIGFKRDLTGEQLQEMSQCLHEVLLSEKETANVTLTVTTKDYSENIEKRVQKLLALGLVSEWEVNDARMAFAQMDLNGDGHLTAEEVLESAGVTNADEEELEQTREQLLRADRNGDGEIDFLEFLMMGVGLIDFNFPDEQTNQGSNKPSPTLLVNAPPIVAGSYDIMVPAGQDPPEGIAGPLHYLYDEETPPDDKKGSILLIDMHKDSLLPLEEQLNKAKSLEAQAVIIVVPEKTEKSYAIGIPVVYILTKDIDTIRDGLDAAQSQEEESLDQDDTTEQDQMLISALIELGYSAEDASTAYDKAKGDIALAAGYLQGHAKLLSRVSSLKSEVTEEDEDDQDPEDDDEMDIMSEGEDDDASENEKEEELSYLSPFTAEPGQEKVPQQKSVSSQLQELNLRNLRGEVVRVEKGISVQHARQAVLSALANWPSDVPLKLETLGVDAESVVNILRFCLNYKQNGKQFSLEDLIPVFVMLIEEENSDMAQLLIQECVGTILLESRLKKTTKDMLKEVNPLDLKFALSILEILLRSHKTPKSFITVDLCKGLIRCLEVASTTLRSHLTNVFTQVLLQIPKLPAAMQPNMSELQQQIQLLQVLLRKQFIKDRKKTNIVGSIYLQSLSELVAVGESLIRGGALEISQTQDQDEDRMQLIACNFGDILDISDMGVVTPTNPAMQSFPSVVTSRYVSSGKYFYEASLRQMEQGRRKIILQLGWATPDFKSDEIKGAGVGDDAFSWCFDGGRQRKWHNARWSAYATDEKLNSGDVIGCAIDLDQKKMDFFLNGQPLGEAFNNFDTSKGICPAASFRTDLILDFNFGARPFEHPIPGYQPFDTPIAGDEGPQRLADFDSYVRTYHLIDYLSSREKMPSSFLQNAVNQHKKSLDKISNKIKLKVLSSDGKSDAFDTVDNMFKDSYDYYSTDKAKNVNVIATSDEEFMVKSVYIEAHRGFGVVNPIRNALVWVLDDKPDLPKFSAFDDFTKDKWEEFSKKPLGAMDPVAYLHVPAGSANATFKLETPRKGKFILIKLLSSSSSSRLDITYFAANGQPGPFSGLMQQIDETDVSTVKCNNDTWTLDMDEQLTQFIQELAQRLDTGALALTPGQLVSHLSSVNQILYPSLKKVQPDQIVYRHHIIWLLNNEVNSALYWIDLSNPKRHTIASKICSIRGLIFLDVKTKFLHLVLDDVSSSSTTGQSLRLNRLKALQQRDKTAPKNDLDTLFGQAFTQLHHHDANLFRVKDQPWTVTFLGEGGIDAGGLYRDSLSQFCTELQSEALSLFQKTPNGQHNAGLNREMWVPVPSASSATQISMYEFLGKLFGLVLYTQFTLNLDLPAMVWKPLVGMNVDLSDLKAIDAMCVQSLDALRTIDQKGITEDMFEDIITEVFTTNGSDGKEIELKPNGKNIPVTFQNRFEWISLVEKMRTTEFAPQMEAIRRGMSSVIPLPILNLFTWNELKITIEGRSSLDIYLLQRHTVYRAGYSEDDETVKNFWKVIESLTPQQHSLFLRFTWGRSRLPLFSDQFTQEFKLSKMSTETPDKTLPTSHTCFFELELPAYSSYEVMREKLIYAISECEAIDTDFNPSNADIWQN